MDKYQGQQNDYILLSLVRTRAVGHLRDVRRLVVATSRARLGLYVFGRRELFANCYELRPAMEQMTARPGQLLLHPVEHWEVSQSSAASELQGWSWGGLSLSTSLHLVLCMLQCHLWECHLKASRRFGLGNPAG